MPDMESLKGLGVIGGLVVGYLVGGKIIYWLIELIKTRDKNQMDRDDKRDTLLLNLQMSIVAQDKALRDHIEHQENRDRLHEEERRERARTAVYRQADQERERGSHEIGRAHV